MTNYFFLLGRQPQLSLAELKATLALTDYWPEQPEKFLVAPLANLKPQQLIQRLGGTIKIGEIIHRFDAGQPDVKTISQELFNLASKLLPEKTGKIKLGVNIYNQPKLDQQKFALGLELKKSLRAAGRNCRLVTSREPTLSSVVVSKNKLLTEGVEFNLFTVKDQFWVGRTLAVQPFAELSARDYGRPARDDRSGLMPPKLAKILINLTVGRQSLTGKILLDPFCGSGTILQEAIMLGFKQLIGSDISPQAIDDTQANLNWLAKQALISPWPKSLQLFTADVLTLKNKLPAGSADFICAETYLGPPRFSTQQLPEIMKNLEALYNQAMPVLSAVLKTNGRLGLVLPVYNTEAGLIRLNLAPGIKASALKIINQQELLYSRPQQKVLREILLLEKI